MTQSAFPEIVTHFDQPGGHFNDEIYSALIRKTLSRILPENLFMIKEGSAYEGEHQGNYFQALLPYMTWTVCDTLPSNISFFAVSRSRTNAFRFFFEMITHWLVPGKPLNAVSLFAGDFSIPTLGNELFTLCEVVIRIEDPEDLEHIQANLPTLETEIRLGMESSYYARRILEIKGVTADVKIALVHEQIAHLIKRLPALFDYDVISEMQHLFVMCKDEFKEARTSRHLSRMIATLFLMRKRMKDQLKLSAAARHVNVKLFRASIETAKGKKRTLALFVGVNFLGDKEVLEKRHLLTAIRTRVPDAVPVEGTYISSRRGHEHFCHLYLEIEKPHGELFTPQEISSLQQALPLELKDLIEHPLQPVFMPRNEEEIMRNVLVLSSQIKYVRDIPQMVINFDEQTHTHLVFNLILVHVVRPGAGGLQETIKNAPTTLEFIHERSKTIGYLRNKYTKEAVIFRVKLPKDSFLRRDHSIDLYKARQTIVMELSSLIGDIRDFNGGMIAKQNETLASVRDLMGDRVMYNDHQLENFFFSMMPPVIRTLIEPVAVKRLFLMIQELVGKEAPNGEGYAHQIHAEPDFVFLAVRGGGVPLRDEIAQRLSSQQYHPSEVASTSLRVHEVPYLGYIYRCDDESKQSSFCRVIENTLSAWTHKKNSKIKK